MAISLHIIVHARGPFCRRWPRRRGFTGHGHVHLRGGQISIATPSGEIGCGPRFCCRQTKRVTLRSFSLHIQQSRPRPPPPPRRRSHRHHHRPPHHTPQRHPPPPPPHHHRRHHRQKQPFSATFNRDRNQRPRRPAALATRLLREDAYMTSALCLVEEGPPKAAYYRRIVREIA